MRIAERGGSGTGASEASAGGLFTRGPRGTYHFWANSGSPSPPPQTWFRARIWCLPSPAARARPGRKVRGQESESSSTSSPRRSLHETGTGSAGRGSHMPKGRRPSCPAGQLPCPIQGTPTRAARLLPPPGGVTEPRSRPAGAELTERKTISSRRGRGSGRRRSRRPFPTRGTRAERPHPPSRRGLRPSAPAPRPRPEPAEDPLAVAAAPAAQQTPPTAPRPRRPRARDPGKGVKWVGGGRGVRFWNRPDPCVHTSAASTGAARVHTAGQKKETGHQRLPC